MVELPLLHFLSIGVPIKSSNSIDGWDSVLSILQMPNGVPVATVALNAARMQAYWLLKLLAALTKQFQKISDYKKSLNNEVIEKVEKLKEGWLGRTNLMPQNHDLKGL